MFQRQPICHNLLFALRPPPILARQIAVAAQVLGDGAQPADRLHVTLFILSGLVEVDPALLAALSQVGAAVARAPVRIVFDRMTGSDGYVALRPSRGNPELTALHDRLVALARDVGVAPREVRAFHPHISLIYRGGRAVNQSIAPISWIADELVLIDSHVGATLHEDRGRWPLVGEPDAQLSLL